MRKSILALMIGFILSFCIFQMPVISQGWTPETLYLSCPSAWSYYPPYGGRPPYSIIAREGALIPFDDEYALFKYISPCTASLATNEFTNPAYNASGPWDPTDTWLPAIDNATIQSVFAVAYFGVAKTPNLTIAVSVNDRASYVTSSLVAAQSASDSIIFDVGAYYNWTPAMVKSADTWVQLTTYLTGDETDYYYVDYIGLTYTWNYTVGGGGGEGGEEGEEGGGFFNGFGWEWVVGDNIIGLLGLCGFFGMIIAPAVVVLAMKKGTIENKFQGVVGAIALGLVCFGLFMVALGGWG